jgi:pimeloyl-ACP methyl ester carboxylesterase
MKAHTGEPVVPTWVTTTLSDGFEVRTSIWGCGPNRLVFVHGLGSDPTVTARALTHWVHQHDATIYALQLPNHGGSGNVHQFEDLVARVVEWAGHHGLAKVPWVGHSLGGLVSLAVAATRPDLVSNLITICSPIGRDYDDMTALDIYVKLWVVGIDVVISTYLAAVQAALHGDPYGFFNAWLGALASPPRLRSSATILLGAQKLLGGSIHAVHAHGIPQTRYWAMLDLAVRPPPADADLPGEDIELFGLHCMPLFFPAIQHISQEIAQALVVSSAAAASRLQYQLA